MEFGLSPSQNRILLAELNHPGTLAYHIYFAMRFAREDEPWLERAITAVIRGNYALRVRPGEGGYVQYYSDESARVETIDMRGEDRRGLQGRKPGQGRPRRRR